MDEVKVYKREAYYIKVKDIGNKLKDKLIDHNTHYFFEDKACADCEWLGQRMESETRLSSACPDCAAFKGGVCLAEEVKLKGKNYVRTPAGDKQGLQKILKDKDLTIKLKHVVTDFKRPIKFISELRDYQDEAVKTIIKKRFGVIKAPPRSGKTVLSTAAICKLGKKTIIMASQREWLDGFYETFCGSETQKPMTNAKKSQVGYAKTYADFLKYDVCLVTCQTFNSAKGKKLLKKIRDIFTVCVIDEVRLGAANKFAAAIAGLNVKYRIGLDGTPNRKDGRFLIITSLIGPVIYEAKVKRLRPRVSLVRTAYTKNYKGRVLWTTMVSSMEKDPERLKLIAKWALKDVKNKHMILIPLSQVIPIKALVMAINRLAGKRVAHAFFGGMKKDARKKVIQDARTYKVRIIVGNTKLISTGTNIPRASMIYEVAMSSNMENCEQRISRVLTPWDDKPPPGVRIFLDEMNVRKRCLSAEWWGCISPKFRPIISPVDEKTLKAYLSSTGRKASDGERAWEM
jgi:superfamily II DNA or RNA helicase